MSKIFKLGKIVVAKANESGNIIETLCVEIERNTRKSQDKDCKIVLYPLLTTDDKYIFENIDIAVKSGLKKENILHEIEKYLAAKNNYGKQENKREFSNKDMWEILIENASTLEDLTKIYYSLNATKILNRYKEKILRKLNEVDVLEPFFFIEFNKYIDLWPEENSDYSFDCYMVKIELLLEKYKNVKYDQIISFNNSLVKKSAYLEELICNFITQWRDYCITNFISDDKMRRFFSLYSKFEYIQFNSYAIYILFHANGVYDEKEYIPKNIKTIFLEIKEKVKNKIKEIHFPMVSFEYNYMRAMETTSCIDFAKASFQASSEEHQKYITILEDKIKSADFNIEEALLLILCLYQSHESKLLWDINIKAITTILDNNNFKNSPNFKRIHYLFYESIYYYISEVDATKKDLLEIKKLYDNNCSKYNEQIKNEFDNIHKWCR